jgi:HPt (histidine-containing phosphotransfer) domain-containing protein
MIKADVKRTDRIVSPPLAPNGRAPDGGVTPVVEPVIDLAHLARMTLGDRSLEAEILALFERQTGILLARMRQVQFQAAGAFAHTLKGSARGIGAWRVAEAAEAVERAASGRRPADLVDPLERLARAIDEARAAIADLLAAS